MRHARKETESIWALVLLASPVAALYFWSCGWVHLICTLSLLLVAFGLYVGFSGASSRWESDSPLIVMSGFIPLVLLLPMLIH